MYAIKQFYLKLFNAKTTMKDKTMMCDETKTSAAITPIPLGKAHRSSRRRSAGWTT